MTWEGYWLPHLIDWGVAALVIPVVGLVVRRVARQAATAAGLHAAEASRAAQDATAAQVGAEAAEHRMRRLEGIAGGVLDSTSAALGLRALDDLRFRTIEQELGIRGRHAAGDS